MLSYYIDILKNFVWCIGVINYSDKLFDALLKLTSKRMPPCPPTVGF